MTFLERERCYDKRMTSTVSFRLKATSAVHTKNHHGVSSLPFSLDSRRLADERVAESFRTSCIRLQWHSASSSPSPIASGARINAPNTALWMTYLRSWENFLYDPAMFLAYNRRPWYASTSHEQTLASSSAFY